MNTLKTILLSILVITATECHSVEELSMSENNEYSSTQEQTPDDILNTIKFKILSCLRCCGSIAQEDYGSCNNLLNDLIDIAKQVETYGETHFKSNRIIKKYKKYMYLNNLGFNCNCVFISRNHAAQYDFDINSIILTDAMVQENLDHTEQKYLDFYKKLNPDEQQECRRIVIEMFDFCKQVVQSIDATIKKYPSVRSKLKQLMNELDQMIIVTANFDHPFPFFSYRLI